MKEKPAAVAPPALVRLAVAASRRAYAPYSGYRVGAALLAANGRVFTGCNVENASYGLTLCAERSALVSAVTGGCRRFRALAVVADGKALPLPCGACLQVLVEFCRPAMPVYIARVAAPRTLHALTLGELLPHAFRLRA